MATDIPREPLDVQPIAERAAQATPGPWGYTYDGSSDWSVGPADDPQSGQIACCHRHRAASNPDAVFIAHARTDIPALLAEVARLRGLIAQAEWKAGWQPAPYEDMTEGACPWCQHVEQNVSTDGHAPGQHAPDCHAFSAPGVPR